MLPAAAGCDAADGGSGDGDVAAPGASPGSSWGPAGLKEGLTPPLATAPDDCAGAAADAIVMLLEDEPARASSVRMDVTMSSDVILAEVWPGKACRLFPISLPHWNMCVPANTSLDLPHSLPPLWE